MKLASYIISFVLIFVALFSFVFLGAASHGHLGLWDHADSFYFYLVIYYCFVLINGLIFLNNKKSVSKNRIYSMLGFSAILFFIGAVMLNITYHEDITSAEDRVTIMEYFEIFLPLALIFYSAYKLLISNSPNEDT